MGKLVIFFLLVNLAQNEANTTKNTDQVNDLKEYVYWNTFSKIYEKTANFWQAESEALEAESIADDRTGIEEWLAEVNAGNQIQNTDTI